MSMVVTSCGGSKQAVQAYPGAGQTYMPPTQPKTDPVEEMVKNYTAEGYKTTSMAFTMYESIYAHRQKLLASTDNVEIVSDGVGASSTSAELNALNAAALKYATAAGSVVRGGMERDFGNSSEGGAYEVFHGTYVQDIQEMIIPLLKASMVFHKTDRDVDGRQVERVRVGYIVNEQNASQVRDKAFGHALEKSGLGMAFGETVRKYIQEMVRPSNE